MGPGDCVVIPPYAGHEALAGPDGCHAVDIFSPLRPGDAAVHDPGAVHRP